MGVMLTPERRPARWAALLVWIAIGAVMPAVVGEGPVQFSQLDFIVALVLAGVSTNIILGFAGQLFIGPTAFVEVAAYVGAVLAQHFSVVSGPTGLLLMLGAGIAAALFVSTVIAVLTLRVSGFYFAMVSLLLALVLPALTGQISLVAIPTFTQRPSGVALYEVGVGLVTAMAGYMWLIKTSRLGRRFSAIAVSEDLAQSVGVSPYWTKLVAFVLAAVPVGLAGGFLTYSQQFASPGTLPVESSIYILAGVVVGGSGTILGPILGTALVGAGGQFLGSFAEYQGLIYGIALAAVAVAMPSGVIGLYRLVCGRVAERLARAPTAVPAPIATGLQSVSTVATRAADEVRIPLDRRVVRRLRAPEGTGAPAALATPAPRAGRPSPTGHSARGDLDVPPGPLRVEAARRAFGGVRAVDGVDLMVAPGQVHALVGPNGSGKTTLLNLISGYYRLDAGAVWLGDVRLDSLRGVTKVARRGVARTFQTPKLIPFETALTNVLIGADRIAVGSLAGTVLHTPQAQRADRTGSATALAALFGAGLEDHWSQPTGLLSHGTQRLVELARVVAAGPSYVLLDEPAAGLSGAETAVLLEVVRAMAARGLGVLIVEHNLPVVFNVADTVTALHEGRVIASGTPAEVSTDPEVIRVYIGGRRGGQTLRPVVNGSISDD